jgi:hypothetical protein
MSDTPTPPSSSQSQPIDIPTSPPKKNGHRKSQIAESIDASNSLLRTVVNLRAEQFLIVILLVVLVGFGLLVNSVIRTQSEDRAYNLRQSEESKEKDRQFYTKLMDEAREKDRLFYQSQREIDRKHCDQREDELRKFVHEEREKDRTVVTSLNLEITRWRDVILPIIKKMAP